MTLPSPPRILTFNHHESFLAAMAPLKMPFDVVVQKGRLNLAWNPTARKVPDHFQLISFETAKTKLKSGGYDYVLCHTIKNLVWLLGRHRAKTVFVAHIPLLWNSPFTFIKSLVKRLVLSFYRIFHQTEFVAVSPWKGETWHLNATITPFYPVAFPSEMLRSPHSAKSPAPARSLPIPVIVGNQIKSRGKELGWDLIEELLTMVPLRILGHNPDIPSSQKPRDFADFVGLFSESEIYVYTVKRPHGDGYNTAMLEAMLLGLPVVTVPNPSSPVVDGHNGLVAATAQGMAEKIKLLQHDETLRATFGREARATVERDFSQKKFLDTWRHLFKSDTLNSGKSQP